MTGADSGDDFLSDGSSFGDVLEGCLHILGDELVHETTGDSNHGNDRGHGKGKFPLLLEGNNKTDDKRRHEAGGQRNLLGDTLLNEI